MSLVARPGIFDHDLPKNFLFVSKDFGSFYINCGSTAKSEENAYKIYVKIIGSGKDGDVVALTGLVQDVVKGERRERSERALSFRDSANVIQKAIAMLQSGGLVAQKSSK